MGHERRRMSERQGLEARNQQAARDALRRRQKAKKAKTVKRHVRYKEKKKLLEELESDKAAAPIVAAELPRMDDDCDTDSDKQRPVSRVARSTVAQDRPSVQERNRGVLGQEREEVTQAEEEVPAEIRGQAKGASREKADCAAGQKKEKKKHLPFTKQMKEFEKVKKEREQKEKERQQRIKVRNTMLQKSKKKRHEQSKQYRKVTTKGQPVLKHRLDAMLARIQEE